MGVKLDAAQEEAVRQILTEERVAKHVVTGGITYLLARWDGFVKKCQKGYSEIIDEYLNDLSVRDILERLLDKLSDEKLKNQIADLLIPIDEAFKKLIIEDNIQVRPESGFRADPQFKSKYFWCWGIVNNAKGYLADDLAHESFETYKSETI